MRSPTCWALQGVRMMHDEALMQPVNIYTQMPSCAPSAPGLETTGFEISAAGCGGGDGVARYHRAGRDDELSRCDQWRPPDAGRDGGDHEGG